MLGRGHNKMCSRPSSMEFSKWSLIRRLIGFMNCTNLSSCNNSHCNYYRHTSKASGVDFACVSIQKFPGLSPRIFWNWTFRMKIFRRVSLEVSGTSSLSPSFSLLPEYSSPAAVWDLKAQEKLCLYKTKPPQNQKNPAHRHSKELNKPSVS